MGDKSDFYYAGETSWCPGCGDFQLLKSMESALAGLNKRPWEVLVVSGIGQAAKLPHYINANGYNGLHGRALPPAFAAKVVNRKLTVVVTTGDGDCYGEGGNHLIHCIRRNIDITVIVHNNQVYGLTKGQASPTSEIGMVTNTQPQGVISYPFNPMSFAVAMDASFVARSFSMDIEFTADLIMQGVRHKGFALIDVLQPCVTFNKKNTYQWYRERTYKLNNSYDSRDKSVAFQKTLEWGEKIPVGVIYMTEKPEYTDNVFDPDDPPLIYQESSKDGFEEMMREFM